MDRIRKALDLARQERNRSSEPESLTPTPRSPPSAAKAPRKLLARIEYTNTRVFAVDPKALESKRIVNPSSGDPAAAAFRFTDGWLGS